MVYYIPDSVETVELDDKVVFYQREEYVDVDGSTVPLVKEALPILRDGTSANGLAERTSLDVQQATGLLQTLNEHGLVEETNSTDDRSKEVPADLYHLEARTDPKFAADALDQLETTPTIAVPQELTDIIDVEYDWPTIPHNEVVLEDVESCLASITYHNNPTKNRQYQEAATKHGFYHLPLRLFHTRFILGPVFSSGSAVGFESAYERERANGDNPVKKHQLDNDLSGSISFPLTAEMQSLVSGTLVTELKKVFTKYHNPNTVNRTVTVNFETLESTRRSVLQVPKGEQ